MSHHLGHDECSSIAGDVEGSVLGMPLPVVPDDIEAIVNTIAAKSSKEADAIPRHAERRSATASQILI